MPLYLVERTFPLETNWDLPNPRESFQIHQGFLENNDLAGVRWMHSFVTPNGSKSFCLYEGPNPEAVRRAAGLNGLPVDRISEVQVHAPYEISVIEGNRPAHVRVKKEMIDEFQQENRDRARG